MSIIHTRIHALSRFRRMRMTSVACDEGSLVYGELGCYALADDVDRPPFYWIWEGDIVWL